MIHDKRTGLRLKVIKLKVRYKSATVDQFIERHALDISPQGMYIQTATPLAFGTTVHLDIGLATEHTVIKGTGCVVWTRDVAHATRTRPPGMGVKFLELDAPSKAIIDKLVSDRGDAGLAYEEHLEMEDATIVAPPRSRARQPSSTPPVAGASMRRPTLMGIGVSPVPPVPQAAQTNAPVAASPSERPSMFPQSDPHAETPQPPDVTLIRQVSEVLDAALNEVAASSEELTDPLLSRSAIVASTPAPGPSPTESKAERSGASEEPREPDPRPPRITDPPGGSSRRRSRTGVWVVSILLASIVLAPTAVQNKLFRIDTATAPVAYVPGIERETPPASAPGMPSVVTARVPAGLGPAPAAPAPASSDTSGAAAPGGPAGASPIAATVPATAPLPIGRHSSPVSSTHAERRITKEAPIRPARPKRPWRPAATTGADDNPY